MIDAGYTRSGREIAFGMRQQSSRGGDSSGFVVMGPPAAGNFGRAAGSVVNAAAPYNVPVLAYRSAVKLD